ncbi:MAG: hypothetical protein GX321_05210 [Clostridiales bacterium]|nr:hypothetical protein [Clostridiales bacterium]
MMQLLVFRERVKNFYQRYDAYLIPVVKFIFAFIAFQTINKEIGYDARLNALPVVLALSLLSAFTPSSIMVLLATLVSVLHVYFISPILSIIVIVIMLILYLLFARFTPKQGYVILAIPILFILKIPYTIPILLGLVATPITMIPTSCGVIVYFLFQIIKTAVTKEINISVEEIVQFYTYIIDSLIENRQMIMTIVVFALIIMVTFFIRKMSFDYAFEISILAGGLTCILGFLISYLVLGRSDQILSMILGTIVSIGIVYIIHFFRLTLDYSGVETAQFEDDVYYYYVKAVPKVTVTVPQVNVKRINTRGREFSEPDIDDVEDIKDLEDALHYNYEDEEDTN